MVKHLWCCCVGLFGFSALSASDTATKSSVLSAPQSFTTSYSDKFSNTIKTNCVRVDQACKRDDSGHESCYYICTSTHVDYPREADADFNSFQPNIRLSTTLVMLANCALAARFAARYCNGRRQQDAAACCELLGTAFFAASLSALDWAIAGYPDDKTLCMCLLSYALGAIVGPS